MEPGANRTLEAMFHLVGFSGIRSIRFELFFFFLFLYILILAGNLMIIYVSLVDVRLRKPMYYFLTHLSILEGLYTTVIIPKMLQNFLVDHQVISPAGCFAQMYLFCFFAGTESLLLGVMAFDRYLAICKPLHYAQIMHSALCQRMTLGSWLFGSTASLIPTTSLSVLPFCSSRTIDHFFCDLLPILLLACSDTSLTELSTFVLTFIFSFGTFSWTLVSYIFIIKTIFRMSSSASREKAFSTCSSHLMVVSLYYGTVITMYMGPKQAPHLNKLIGILYTIVTPLFNPFIYTLRNKDVRRAMKTALQSAKRL
ncbi:olfactory receptor 10A7-like [Pelodytes ibericus]